MSGDIENFRQDIAFLRALVEDSDSTMAFDGAVLTAVGVIFGFVGFFYWLHFAEILRLPMAQWAWVVGLMVLLPCIRFLQKHFPQKSGAAASRAVSAAWAGIGIGITVAGIAFGMGSWRLQLPSFVLWTFPVVLFTLYGTAWNIAFSVRRRTWLALIAGGCYATALACGFFMGEPYEWLVLSIGLFLLVAAPGFVIVHRSRSQ